MASAAQANKVVRRRLTQRGEKNYSTTDINKAFNKWAEKRGIPVMDAATVKRRIGRIAFGKNANKPKK